jgi:polyisoprenyl-phosphate glycosyltransferase
MKRGISVAIERAARTPGRRPNAGAPQAKVARAGRVGRGEREGDHRDRPRWFVVSVGPMPRPTLSLVIPLMNEEEVIPELDRRLRQTLEGLGIRWEVIFVNDGSTDRSLELLRALSEGEPRYKILSLSRNFGHQIAITAGLDHTDGEAVVVMDADLQDPPELIGDMLAKWREGYDIVHAVRSKREGESLFKRATAALFYRLTRRLAGIDLPVDTGDFRLISFRALLALRALRETHRFVRGFIVWVGFKQGSIQYVRTERLAGITKYPFRKMVRFAIDGITSFSIIPLRISSFLGILSGMGAVGLAIWAVWVRFFVNGVVPGWTSGLLAISLVSAAQLLMIGILGEYVGRIYEEVKRRPLYFIGEQWNLTPGHAPAPERDARSRPLENEL